jgi:hypothetical protein
MIGAKVPYERLELPVVVGLGARLGPIYTSILLLAENFPLALHMIVDETKRLRVSQKI